ncbi:MAG: redoxin domain-containing protein [Bacteroidales bacterium]|nr:redoxin domain-containing protein [Bacteroidales bacterium]
MKSLSIVLAAATLIFLSSAAQTERAEATPGAEAPALQISNAEGMMSLAQQRGKYVIVNFWSSDDPESRIANALYDREFSKSQASEVNCISVCTDSDRNMFEAIVKTDELQTAHQYFHEDSRLANILADYSRLGINTAYLISPEGRVIAVNPDVDYVKSLLSAQRA